MKVGVEGLADLDRALAEMKKATAVNTSRRGMETALQPVLDAAKAKVPVRKGNLRSSLGIGKSVKRGTEQVADSRMAGVLAMYVGPVVEGIKAGGKKWQRYIARHAHLVEFGTGPRVQKTTGRYVGRAPAQPFLRPAWDENKAAVLKSLAAHLWTEITKSQARTAKAAARAAAKAGK